MKLAYSHWRLRKYTAVAERERKEQAMHRQMSQRRRTMGGHGSNDVPFGIRAIESGIEVEGVWISRSNTPELTSKNTSAGSSMWEHVPRRNLDPDLERQDLPRGRNRTMSNPTTAIARPDRTSFERAVSAEKLPSTTSTNSSPDPVIAKPPRSRHPPLSYTRYSCNPYLIRYPSTTSTLEGLDAIHKASTSIHGDGGNGSSDSSNPSSDSTDDSGPISASAPALLTGQARPRTRHQSSGDLEMLNSHRKSQAAETGQLTPRGRRQGQSYSVDFSAYVSSARDSRSVERSDYFSTQSKMPSPTSGNSSPTNPFSTPKLNALPAAVRRSSMPDVTPFAEFCKRASHDPRPESLRSQSRDSAQSVLPKSDNQSPCNSAPSSPIIPASEGAAEMKLPHPKRISFEKRASQVIRGHGTGFEILKPGSLKPPMPKEHPMERQRAAPPISLENSTRTRSNSMESRRKLQKKRRPSLDSTTSSDISRRSRISLFS